MPIGANQRGTTLHSTRCAGIADYRLTSGCAWAYLAYTGKFGPRVPGWAHLWFRTGSQHHRLSETKSSQVYSNHHCCYMLLIVFGSAKNLTTKMQFIIVFIPTVSLYTLSQSSCALSMAYSVLPQKNFIESTCTESISTTRLTGGLLLA